MEAAIIHQKAVTMAERLQAIGSNVYVQWSLVAGLLTLVALVVEHKVTTQADIRMLREKGERMEKSIETMQSSLPTKDYLDLKCQNIEEQIDNLKQKGK